MHIFEQIRGISYHEWRNIFFIKSVACKTFPLRMAIGYIKSDSEYNLSETFAGVNASWISHIAYTYIRYKQINECDK